MGAGIRARRAATRTAGGAGALLLLVGILGTAFVWRPEWFLRPHVLVRLVQRYGRAYDPEWKRLEPAIRSRSFLDKELTLHAEGLCARDGPGSWRACFDRVDLAVTLRLGRRPFLLEVSRAEALARSLVVDRTKAPPRAPSERKKRLGRALADLLPGPTRRARLRSLHVSLPNLLVVESSTRSIAGSAEVSFSTAQTPPLLLGADLRQRDGGKERRIEARALLDSDLFTVGQLTHLDAMASLRSDDGSSVVFEARAEQRDEELGVSAEGTASLGARRGRFTLKGALRDDRLEARASGRLDDSSGTIRSATLESCNAGAGFDEDGRPQRLNLACRVVIEPQPFADDPRRSTEKLAAFLRFSGARKPRPLAPDRFEADLSLRLVPVKRWFEFSGELEAKIRGSLDDLPGSLEAQHDLRVGLRVEKFEDLVAYLKDTDLAVPAPLHVLRGPVSVSVNNSGDTTAPDQRFTYYARTELTSGRQSVFVSADGDLLATGLFTPGRSFESSTEVALESVALELPYLKFSGLPAVKVDSRIRTGEETPAVLAEREAALEAAENGDGPRLSTSSRLAYRVHVATKKPALLHTNLNPRPIPLTVDLTATNAGVEGSVTVQRFTAELFKREADVERVAVTMKRGVKAAALDGLVRFKLPEADVRIKLLGTTSKPTPVFESEPPMTQQDIVAMLLFGKHPDDLDPDQKTTASNSQSAMATGAFGLASLYLFASTPIQYVGYDPATQSYAMKLKLPGGATLEVGNKGRTTNHLTLRKRLARHWVLETEAASSRTISNSGTVQRNAVTTFLEWFQRY